MIYRILADLVVLTHLAFIVFVIVGGFAVLRWRRVVWIHVPAAAWGFLIEFRGWVCPLTPFENYLRRLGGESGYTGGFIEQYVLPIVYPPGLTRGVQLVLAGLVVGLNVVAYALVWRRRRALRAPGLDGIDPGDATGR